MSWEEVVKNYVLKSFENVAARQKVKAMAG
jgi:hypothetical protein